MYVAQPFSIYIIHYLELKEMNLYKMTS